MAVVTMKQLLEAGVHFGHQTRRWNPKMSKYIFGARNGIYIIDLQKSLKKIEEAYEFLRGVAAEGKSVIFIGTKKQAQNTIKEEALRCGEFYVNERWLGGMLTNYKTIKKRIDRLFELERMHEDGTMSLLPKKEVFQLQKEQERLERFLGGIKDMKNLPGAIYVVDPKKERIAILEARKLGIPVISIVDTNCDPDEVDYVIPGNDDAIRAVNLITRVMANAVFEAKQGMIDAQNAAEEQAQQEAAAETADQEAAAETADQEAAAEVADQEVTETPEAPETIEEVQEEEPQNN